jgi:hypothetical protein
MNKDVLILQLKSIENAKRINRLRVANIVLENKELFKYLLELVFEVDNKLSIKAAWVLEFVCVNKLNWLAPHLDYFTNNISLVKFDSSVRPISKICNFLAISYNSKNDSLIKSTLTKHHIDLIIESGFDWMISDQKVAVKAYTMNFLFLFGKNSDWVHNELKLIIQQNIMDESAAYKARGKITLSLINKK